MDKIATLRYILQAYIDSGRLIIYRYMDVDGAGEEEIIFLGEHGISLARIKTDYIPNLAEIHSTYELEGDYVRTHLVLEMVPPLPELNCEEFIGERNIVVSGIDINRYDIRMLDLFPCLFKRSNPYRSVICQKTPAYLTVDANKISNQ
jgi:hypothetical protein